MRARFFCMVTAVSPEYSGVFIEQGFNKYWLTDWLIKCIMASVYFANASLALFFLSILLRWVGNVSPSVPSYNYSNSWWELQVQEAGNLQKYRITRGCLSSKIYSSFISKLMSGLDTLTPKLGASAPAVLGVRVFPLYF